MKNSDVTMWKSWHSEYRIINNAVNIFGNEEKKCIEILSAIMYNKYNMNKIQRRK